MRRMEIATAATLPRDDVLVVIARSAATKQPIAQSLLVILSTASSYRILMLEALA